LEFWNFLTSETAPWWSALVGTVVGGVITYLTTSRATQQQREAERLKTEDERFHADKDRWRQETITLVSELMVANYRYLEHILVSRRILRSSFPRTPAVDSEAYRDYSKLTADLVSSETLPMLSELQRLFSLFQVTSGGDIADAATNLVTKLNEHTFDLSNDDFNRTRQDASMAAALLTTVAQKDLGLGYGSATGIVSNTGIASARTAAS
jgi:hypothetical protein